MDIARRGFLKGALGAVALAAAPALWLFARLAPRRIIEAIPGRRYPGPLRRRDDAAVRKPGRWAG
ncbi:MAG TPA: hypothetical protein HPP77_06580 [Candidatus Hydrogenedentes bacterium]|nr:hypothetical protein [Candidatus Hydrogenedentota bacterium]HIJ74617.1 hypothetical protein [Candidatus Hydrogenedentota bacterium]